MIEQLQRVDPGWLIFVGVFLGGLLFFEGFRQLVSRRESVSEARSRRLRMIAQGIDIRERLEILAPARRSGHAPVLDLTDLLAAAGLPPRPVAFAAASILATAAIALIAYPYLGALVAVGAATTLCIVLPLLVLAAIREARRQKLVAQLPDALDLMARGLQVGHPLGTSIQTVAKTLPDPIGSEFGIMVDQVSYGDEIVSAVRKLADRNPGEDFQYLAASIAIQHGSGGNLVRVLTVLSQVMRDRAMMRRRITAMTAEGRISALILSLIPFIMVGLNSIITPSYYGDIVDDPKFLPLAVTAVALIVANGLVLYRLVHFRI